MKLSGLAFYNFRHSVREYGVLILSLAFSVFIFFSFQNVVYSDSVAFLESMRKDMIEMGVQAASVVFGVFFFFFTWYATGVFLQQRKRETGIYIFMGLDNRKIGKLYALEAFFTGLAAWAAGTGTGILFSRLFQMLLLKLSDVAVEIRFSISLKPVLITAAMFWGIYGLMVWRGYRSVVKSSVTELLSSAKQKEHVRQGKLRTALLSLTGAAVLAAGYVCALKTGRESSLNYALAAVILVVAGVWLLYDGLIPAVVEAMCRKKKFLYRKQRTLWINSLSWRMKKNYRMYAMVTILMITAVTVLGTAIALHGRYENSRTFRNTYTFQVAGFGEKLDRQEIIRGIEEENKVEYSSEIRVLALPAELFHTPYVYQDYGVIAESQIRQAAEDTGLTWEYPGLQKGECVELTHIVLLSLADSEPEKEMTLGDTSYRVLGACSEPFLGDLQNDMSFYVLDDQDYEALISQGAEMTFYNFRIENPENLEASEDFIRSLSRQDENGNYLVGTSVVRPEDSEGAYIRITYSLCLFLFVTIILAAGSILFLKAGNDAREDRERYQVLEKLGIPERTLRKSLGWEIRFTYYCPVVLMAVSSWFSLRALSNVMLGENLIWVNLFSALFILAVFAVICLLSERSCWKTVTARKS
ncbi:MAG TPA: ABC transporter permease [Candidatus Bariatricus faecipullorum]|nr:ABC transporter permease [Candidatus Bariatricus faecipullorum]